MNRTDTVKESMAAVKDEEYDLAFLETDDQDETDAVSTRVIQLERDSEIPTRYLIRKIFSPQLEPPYHYHPAAEASQRPQKVHGKWGSDIGKEWYSFSRPDDVVALLTFEDLSKRGNTKLDEAVIWKIAESLKKISGDPKLEPLRSSGLQLLMKFSLPAGYETLGKCFLDGRVEEVSHLKLVEIQAVSLGTPPPCYIEVACPASQGDSLRESLTSLFVSKSSVFPFLSIREPEHKFADRVSPSNSPATKTRRVVDNEVMLPAVVIMLMFTQRAQRNSESCVNAMKGNPKEWDQVQLPQEISERDEIYFKATALDGPLIAVKKLAPCSGVRIILFVNRDMAEVERFYSLITGKSPLAYNKIEEGLSCRNFPLSEKLEFQLISHPSLRSHPVKNVALCFMMNDVNKMCSEIPGGVRNIGEGHWQVKDPEGNAVILYSLLK